MEGSAFSPETTFRANVINPSGEPLGTAVFSAYLESGGPVPPEQIAAAIREVFQQHGLDLRQFEGPVSTLLDWPQEG
jgi:hypothetical protein